MSSRDRILERLARAAPDAPTSKLPDVDERAIFADYPDLAEDRASGLLELFEARFTALSGELVVVRNEKEAAAAVSTILDSADAGPVVAQSHPLLEAVLGADPNLAARVEIGELERASERFGTTSAGISAVDFFIARTGSLVLRNTTCGGRRLSVLPPLHIAVARSSQLLPSLGAALERLDGDWSFATLVTGPSRTADIEKILVLGAHGPKRLVAVVIL